MTVPDAAVPVSTAASIRARALAIAVGVGAFGVSFGAVSVAAGLTVLQACLLSLAVFTGASQFAFVGVVQSGGSLGLGVAGALALGGRNALYGLRMARLLRGGGGLRTAVSAQLVVDETAALATAQPDDAGARYAFTVMAVLEYTLWNLGTLAGALLGARAGDPARFGLDAAFPAAFVALLAPRLASARARLVAGGAVVLALATTPLLPPGTPILVAALASLPALWRRGEAPATGEGQESA